MFSRAPLWLSTGLDDVPAFCLLLTRKDGQTEAVNFRMLYMQFDKLVLVIFKEFVRRTECSNFQQLNVSLLRINDL